MRIIDSHIHLKPNDTILPGQLVAELQHYGIGMAILSNLGGFEPYPEMAALREYNRRAAEFTRASRGVIQFLAYLNPQLANWREELAQCIRDGCCGIKLWISIKDARGSLRSAIEVLHTAAEQQLPVLLHVFNRTCEQLPGEINMADFIQLAQEAPETQMIAAHFGGNWQGSVGMVKNLSRNIYLDISGFSPPAGLLEELCRSDGAERILYGSDGRNRSFASQLSKVLLANISESDREKILWKNCARLYRFGEVADLLPPSPVAATNGNDRTEHFIFSGKNVLLSSLGSSVAQLEKALDKHSIRRAYTVDLDAVLGMNQLAANRRFLRHAEKCKIIRPLFAINPRAANAEILAETARQTRAAGVWTSPYLYHYQVDGPEAIGFFDHCEQKGLRIWLNVELGDYRFRFSGLAPRVVLPEELIAMLDRFQQKSIQIVVQGCSAILFLAERYRKSKNIFFEFSRLSDQEGGIAALSPEACMRLVPGSEYPLRHLLETRLAISSPSSLH